MNSLIAWLDKQVYKLIHRYLLYRGFKGCVAPKNLNFEIVWLGEQKIGGIHIFGANTGLAWMPVTKEFPGGCISIFHEVESRLEEHERTRKMDKYYIGTMRIKF